nr:hypothetical protein [Gordonia sp. LAM0048]
MVFDACFAGVRNVFLRVGEGRIHLYEQPPSRAGAGTVHHLGVATTELVELAARLRRAQVSVTDVRYEPAADYVMVKGPDELLIEVFQPHLGALPAELHEYFGIADHDRHRPDAL